MEYSNLGTTGLSVSKIGLGAMNFGRIEKSLAFELLDKMHDLGINFIDTASGYGDSEKILGEWINSSGLRDDIVINTKVGWPVGKGKYDRGLSRRHITRQLDNSLKQLQTDRVDIYQPHYYNGEENLLSLVKLFDGFVNDLKIDIIGGPTFTRTYHLVAWQYLAKMNGFHPIHSKLLTTSLLSRGMYDGETRAIAKEYDIGLVTFGSLGGGLLSGKYHSKEEYPENGREFHKETVLSGKIDPLIDRLRELAIDLDTTPAKLSFAWVLSHDFMDSIIIGASDPDQLDDILEATELSVSSEILKELKDLSAEYKLW